LQRLCSSFNPSNEVGVWWAAPEAVSVWGQAWQPGKLDVHKHFFHLFSFDYRARRLRVRALLCWTWDGVSTAKLLGSPYSTLIFSHTLNSSGLVSFYSTFTGRQFLNSILDGVHSLFQVIA